MSNSKKVLFAVSGSIAAFKAAEVVSKLVQSGHEVQVVLTKNAHRFVGASSFEGLTGRPVLSDLFEPGRAMAHVDFTRWADLFVICPCSAELMSKMANASPSDLPSSLFLAQPKGLKCLIFPAMNKEMWSHPLLQKNVRVLNELDNVAVLEPASGSLACGETGEGRLLEPLEILKHIQLALHPRLSPSPRVLITGGGTSEAIDSVRALTNFSTGNTAILLAEHLNLNGFQVDLLLSKTARQDPAGIKVKRFSNHQNLSDTLKEILSMNLYAGVIHLAAVSDFRISAIDGKDPKELPKKISSLSAKLTIELERTSKIIDSLREWSKNKSSKIIGFKLTSGSSPEDRIDRSIDLLRRAQLDGVVSNDLTEISEAGHEGFLLLANEQKQSFQNKKQLFQILMNQLRGTL